jgi:hypothetical protein
MTGAPSMNASTLPGRVPITASAESVLEQLASKLDISDTHYEAAERSYQSVGEWLNRAESSLARYNPAIYSQGSFRLGTVVRPPSDEDCFDLDIVCEVDCSKEQMTQQQLKDAVGIELAAYAKQRRMQAPESGQYCWTMLYADSAQFQMDVLPAIPDETHQRLLLKARGLDVTWVKTAIGLTNTEHPQYYLFCREWPTSNPRGYGNWFRKRMEPAFLAKRRSVALLEGKADVEQIPEYRVKTPLQSAIQILKRHRDGAFADRLEFRPASIILTTLAAHAYAQEESISGALFSILVRMDAFIESRDGIAWIPNPTDPRENFANRWEGEPGLKDAFAEWLQTARQDFQVVAHLSDAGAITERLAKHMGRSLLEKVSLRGTPSVLAARRPTALARILGAAHRQAPSWPVVHTGSAGITATASRDGFRPARFWSNGPALAKHCTLKFEASTDVPWPYHVYWQIVNTGEEARDARCLRGSFELTHTERGGLRKIESTLYAGTHSIECFIVRNGYCVAQSAPFIVNIQ